MPVKAASGNAGVLMRLRYSPVKRSVEKASLYDEDPDPVIVAEVSRGQ
jgi:hypothetical protein